MIRDGFKKTEIGVIPKEWTLCSLKSVNKRKKTSIYPSNFPMEKFEYYSIPAYQKFRKPIIEKGANIYSQKLLLKKGTILFGKLNPRVEKVWKVQSYSTFRKIGSTEWIPIFPDEDKINSDFLYYIELSKHVMPLAKNMITGSTPSRQRVDSQAFYEIKIPLPPLSEQKKIAAVLRAVQEAKEKTEEVIKAAKELKKSLMKHLFTYGPVSIEEAEKVKLKETEIGMTPGDWKVNVLEDLAFVKGGKRLPKGHKFSAHPTPFPYIRVIDFHNWSVDKSHLKYLTLEDRKIIEKYTISSDDVYISIAGTIGLVGTVPKELNGANLTENAARIIIKDKAQLDKYYLVSFLSSEKGQNEINKRTTKTSQPKLALMRIKQVPVLTPSIHIQKKTTNIICAVNKRIEAEENRKKALGALFKTLLNNLMTGKMRLNNLDIEV